MNAAIKALLLGGLVCLPLGPTAANEFERIPPVAHAPTKRECGECHMAYQPALLPAASWDRIMDGLSDHFGEDASLEAGLAADIRAHLTKNAAGRGDPGVARITEQRWWSREHRKFRPEVWQRKDVGSKANCEACHRDAASGIYEDD